MRRYLAALLRLTADHLDPLPEPESEPCPLPHWPVTSQPVIYPPGWTEWTCETTPAPYTINGDGAMSTHRCPS